MEDGAWELANRMLSMAMAGTGRGSGVEAASVASYLVAVSLLRGVESADSSREAARVMRYAAALKLPGKHRMPLVRDAIRRNMSAKNYG